MKPNNNDAPAADAASDSTKLVDQAMEYLRPYIIVPLSLSDKVFTMQYWNKVLAFKSSFSEALLLHWRLLIANKHALQQQQENEIDLAGGIKESSSKLYDPFVLVETNRDPLAVAMGTRLQDTEDILMGFLDGAIRSLCPRTQVVAREAYRPIQDDVLIERNKKSSNLSLECDSLQDYYHLFARCGLQPDYWTLFLDACAFAFQTHVPYAQPEDLQDLSENKYNSATLRCVAQTVVVPSIRAWEDLKQLWTLPLYSTLIPSFWKQFDASQKATMGELFYRSLLANYPDLLDYFAQTDMDSLAIHLMQAMDVVVDSPQYLGDFTSHFRKIMEHLGQVHLKMGIPSYSYPLVGVTLIECLRPLFQRYEEEQPKSTNTAEQLEKGFLRLYSEVMSMVYYPMLRQEKLLHQVNEFYEVLQEELQWTKLTFERRLVQIEREITATGTYTQTTEEIQKGARVAWRNSAKCIGRISWNTLQVEDCRHITKPAYVFKKVEDHLRAATAGTNIQCIMTVFRPLSPNESVGQRFFSSQYIRYAGYDMTLKELKGDGDDDNGMESATIMGDPANVALTNYLNANNLWTPPDPKTAFDVLPLVLKEPGEFRPHLHTLPADCLFEVRLEHPTNPKFESLELRWTSVPAISNFKMTLGGVTYPNIPFNGWFLSTEIVRNLMERYNVGPKIAEIFQLDTTNDPFWQQVTAVEVERAVLYSFRKNGFTVVDPYQVGESFCQHIRREREQFGRECPGQWSWIGGLTGPTNPTWHLEMRDFLLQPQYAYATDALLLYQSLNGISGRDPNLEGETTDTASTISDTAFSTSGASLISSLPRVLILYGSETGKAEAAARRLKKMLKPLKPTLMSLNDATVIKPSKLKKHTHMLCITSTFGKGEEPSNAQAFFKMEVPKLSSISFAVLAFGSTLYPDFCKAGVTLDRKLQAAGMERLVDSVTKIDESLGSDQPLTEWLDLVKGLVLPWYLEQELELIQQGAQSRSETKFVWLPPLPVTKDSSSTIVPSNGRLCIENKELTTEGRSRSVRKFTFALEEEQYETGDHLAVQPLNSDTMVQRFLCCFRDELESYAKQSIEGVLPLGVDLLGFQSVQMFDLETVEFGFASPADVVFATPTTLKKLLTNTAELGLNKASARDLLSLCSNLLSDDASVCVAPAAVEFLSMANPLILDQGDMEAFLAEFPTLMHFFEKFSFFTQFSSADEMSLLSLAEVLTVMQRLHPRFYSISSSRNLSPNQVSITVGVLNIVTSKNTKVDGVCSNYLAQLVDGRDYANITIRSSTFRLPVDLNETPIIMVGAGTGLAPMIGFIQELELARSEGKQKLGPIHLFYGMRYDADYLYRDLLEDYAKAGWLTLHVAHSRKAGAPKQYVQDKIEDMGCSYKDLLEHPKTRFYVCGDAVMADCCRESSINVIRKYGRQSRVAAVQTIRLMRAEDRWQADVWGIVSNAEESRKRVKKSKKESAKAWLAKFNIDEKE